MSYSIPKLPLSTELETKPILKKLAKAHQALAELKGVSGIIPNQDTLISILSLQEAKDSSAIENIITTHDELYKSDLSTQQFTTYSAKEVYNYAVALRNGYKLVQKTGLLLNTLILEIQQTLEENSAGFRKLPGTVLKNAQTQKVIYTPPQEGPEILNFMNNLELFINEDSLCDIDPLIKMSIIHHQFESIHPFYDGNGRTGRIINILYLVKCHLLDAPILYLSGFINQNKNTYYDLLQSVRDNGSWEKWILFMLEGIEKTSQETTLLIQKIKFLMQNHKHKIREELPKIYSQDLLNTIFSHPYTKIHFIEKDLNISRITATRYLDELTRIGLMDKIKVKKEIYYINIELLKLFKKSNI